MADLEKYKCYKNSKYRVLTNEGFQDFKGLIVGENTSKLGLQLSNGRDLICTPKHKLILDDESIIFAKDVVVGTALYNNIFVLDITAYTDNRKVYELFHVENTHAYYANGILSHQCLIIDEMAFIPTHIIEEFWKSVIPVISSTRTTKIFTVSTPNKTGNKFHELYTGAERGDLPDWHHERIDWWDIPGRGKKWQREMIQALGSQEAFDQEYGNEFIEVGESAIDGGVVKDLRRTCVPPKMLLDDGRYKIWEEPDPTHLYIAGIDVSEGVGEAASVVQVLDITNLQDIRQVATFCDEKIDPYHFATQINKICMQWGKPWLLIERNNCGGQVIDALYNSHNYTRIVDYTPEKQKYYGRLGVYSHTNSKYRGVTNMRYWLNSLRAVELKDVALIQELETFVRHANNTWKKKPGTYTRDDRVMALCWALFILDTDLVAKYYDVVEYDDQGRPKTIESIDVTEPEYFKLDEYYMHDDSPMPVHFGMDPGSHDATQHDLIQQGWQYR